MKNNNHNYVLKSENLENNKLKKFSNKEIGKLSYALTLKQIDNLIPKCIIDKNVRRKKKWKELLFLWNILQKEKYSKKLFENLFWRFPEYVPVDTFIMIIMNEYHFECSMNIDKHLRILYFSFDENNNDKVNIKDIISSFIMINLNNLLRYNTIDMILKIYDIYSIEMRKDLWCIKNPEFNLLKLFLLPCIEENNTEIMAELFANSYRDNFYLINLYDNNGKDYHNNISNNNNNDSIICIKNSFSDENSTYKSNNNDYNNKNYDNDYQNNHNYDSNYRYNNDNKEHHNSSGIKYPDIHSKIKKDTEIMKFSNKKNFISKDNFKIFLKNSSELVSFWKDQVMYV
jgi:hypothetical protein